jgi:dinuclear metal center YbgI/SA1388 family protein
MTKIKDIIDSLEEWAPKSYAESYDNPGLIVGNRNAEVKGVLVSLDCTEEVVEEAIKKGCNMIVSHHPIVFKGLKKLTGSNYVERTVIKAIQAEVALYAIHTNLDNVPGGVNKMIADKIGLSDVRILSPKSGELEKLEVFVPSDHSDTLREAIFAAGGGEIGEYSKCSFNIAGTGTFLPGEGSDPYSGQKGTMEEAEEVKIEIMYPKYLRNNVLSAMRNTHPYEEVAYYLHPLSNENQFIGSGMVGELSSEMRLDAFLEHLKKSMELSIIRHTKEVGRKIKRVAICGGSGSFLLGAAKGAGADVFITGDFKYHEFFDAENEIVIADIGHYESERFTVDLLATYIRKKFSTFATHFTEVNTNPIHYF